MGISGEEPKKPIDATAGGLVWVCRRNGSWWPGKILGPEELPEGCVATPRSGTPIKLLGREYASVDWYNLEKTKRVKDFHCGEYADCIKKVKESASRLSKKTAKYARREDAILQALELESARLGKDCPDLPSIAATQDEEHGDVDGSPSASHPSEESEDAGENLDSSEDDLDSSQEVSESGLSFGRPDPVDLAWEESEQWRTPNDSEEDGYGVKRMRGLEDLGMGLASIFKKKMSQVSRVHEQYKRKYLRHRPLTKVMASSTMVFVPVSSEIKVSEFNNGVSSGSGDPGNGTSQKLFDVPLVSEARHPAGLSSAVSDASQLARVGARVHPSQSSRVEAVSLVTEERTGSGPTKSGAVDIHDLSQSLEMATSVWRIKGKRNSRSRKVEYRAEPYVAGVDRQSSLTPFSRKVGSKNHGQSLVPEHGGYHGKSRLSSGVQDFHGWSWRQAPKREAHTQGASAEQPAPQRLLPHRQSRLTVNPKYDDSDISLRQPKVHKAPASGLYDVTVQVKTGYQPQRVPYISLMGKATGRPIIGHPLTIEVLDDGLSEDIISNSGGYSSCSELDYNLSQGRRRGRPSTKPSPSRPHSSLFKSLKSRRSTLLSKKMRKLSTLTGSRRLSREELTPVIKKLKGPSIACVPLQVVFSRINAALSP